MSLRRSRGRSLLAATAAAALLVCLAPWAGLAEVGARSTASPTSASLPGTKCFLLPADNVWHADISALPRHARSAQWMSRIGTSGRLHPDFGPSDGYPYGIPYNVVAGTHAKVTVRFDYAEESDRSRYPLGADTAIEGGPGAGGDRHALVVDRTTCRLYETWATRRTVSGWAAGSGAVFDLRSDKLRPAGWTSADAAGLPILPGLLRYDEVVAGRVDHAIRFTVPTSSRAYLWPARHQAGSTDDPSYPPMGARFRLRGDFSLSGYSAKARVVLVAMKRYGLILADNGSPWYFQGTADRRWPTGLLDELKSIPAGAFEAVDESSLMASPGSGRVR